MSSEKTRRRGFRSVSVRNRVFEYLVDIARREGLSSVAEAVEHLVHRYVGEDVGREAVRRVIARLLFEDKGPGSIVKVVRYGEGAYPLTFLSYRLEWDDGLPRVVPVLGVNPLPIILTYCPGGAGGCRSGNLLQELEVAQREAGDALRELVEKKSLELDFLEKLGVDVSKLREHYYEIRLEVPAENLGKAKEHLKWNQL